MDKMSRRAALRAAVATGAALGFGNSAKAVPVKPVIPRERLFDASWLFHRGDVAGAEQAAFDDTGWRKLDLPHDWSIEDAPGARKTADPWVAPAALWNAVPRRAPKPGEFIVMPQVPPEQIGNPPHAVGPFDANRSPGKSFAGWTLGGTGWYRKRFFATDIGAEEVVEIRFDGVYKDCEFWLNGQKVGEHDHGHAGFVIDLTPHLYRDRANVLAVRVRNEGLNSRWYSGSGIYRHVWLRRTGPVRIPLWGVFVSTPALSAESAIVRTLVEVETRAKQPSSVDVLVTLKDDRGEVVGAGQHSLEVRPQATAMAELIIHLASPRRWSPEQPTMHSAEVVLKANGEIAYRTVVPFGIRSIAVDVRNGLTVNGKPVKLRGACLHANNGLLGAASYDRAEWRKVELLKSNGFNALRCSHNLYSPAFLDACDALGMIVIDESFDVWFADKMGMDLGARRFQAKWRSDVADMVKRDRNHPSIFFWSIGNEIPERNEPKGVEIAANLRKAVLELDDTRLVTAALAPMVSGKDAEPSFRSLDVIGYNYMQDAYEKDHTLFPERVFMGTEQYAFDIHAAWKKVERYPWLIGDFVWTGIDYIGEVGTGSSQLRRDGEEAPPGPFPFVGYLWDYPAYLSGCGEIDILGLKKPQSYYRDVLWDRSPLELFVQRPAPEGFHEERGNWAWHDELQSWTWPGAAELTVRAYTGGDEVRLLLNGREVSRKSVSPTEQLTAEFKVPYAPGDLVAVAYRNGAEIARKALVTVGTPTGLRLRPEREHVSRALGELAYVLVEVIDAVGRLVPDAQQRLSISIEGPARLIAAGSANPWGAESFRDDICTTFHGVAQVILAPTGKRGDAILRVSSPGIEEGRARISYG